MVEFTLENIHEKKFHVRFRGFDVDEVDEFLELIAENYAVLIKENKKLSTKVEELSEELGKVNKQENSFRNAILSAQKIADQMVQKSKEESEKIIQASQEEAKQIKDEALQEVTLLETRVDQLKEMQAKFEKEIQEVIDLYQDSLDNALSKKAVLSEPEVEETERPEPARNLTKTEPDLSDLYEKIDLNEDLTLSAKAKSQFDISLANNKDLTEEIDIEVAGEPNKINIPDLDSDLMFTLHDPLDDDDRGIDVEINSDFVKK